MNIGVELLSDPLILVYFLLLLFVCYSLTNILFPEVVPVPLPESDFDELFQELETEMVQNKNVLKELESALLYETESKNIGKSDLVKLKEELLLPEMFCESKSDKTKYQGTCELKFVWIPGSEPIGCAITKIEWRLQPGWYSYLRIQSTTNSWHRFEVRGLQKIESFEAFIKFFASLGFEDCGVLTFVFGINEFRKKNISN
jgi:hypothetical protein